MSVWPKAPLSVVCSLVTDGTHHSPPNYNIGTYRYVTAKNIRPWGLDLGDITFVDEATHREIYSRCPVEVGDVLYIKDGVTTGLAAINTLSEPFSLLSSVALLKPIREVVFPAYLKHWLNSPNTKREMTSGMTGTAIKRLVLKKIRAAEIPVAPLNEQRRIAEKLDTVLTRVDSLNTRLARISPLLKRFRQSVLAAATSGRLTEDWRNSNQSMDWSLKTIDSLCVHIGDGPFGSNLKSDDYSSEGARVVRLENIGHLNFNFEKKTFISLVKYASLKKYTLAEGDILFSSFVDEEVRVCQFPGGVVGSAINKADCFCIRPDGSKVDGRFLAVRLASKRTYEDLKELVHGATRPRINLKQLRGLELMLPSMVEQSEIVRRVDVLFAFADRIEARLQAAQNSATRMTPSLLAKAFRGELVPQDPDDEPAAELLKRLAEARPASKVAKKERGPASTMV